VNLTEKEVYWLIEHEFALTAEDILWRRTKLGLRFTKEQQQGLQHWLNQQQVPNCELEQAS
jgi:glycerol-3-phosphate dehydrogenase